MDKCALFVFLGEEKRKKKVLVWSRGAVLAAKRFVWSRGAVLAVKRFIWSRGAVLAVERLALSGEMISP